MFCAQVGIRDWVRFKHYHGVGTVKHAPGRRQIRTMEELSSAIGVSRPTISKFFNNPDSVRASTRQKIEFALEKYPYKPNFYAVNINRRLTKNIGVVVPFLSDPFFSEISRNVELLCIDAGFRPILLSSHGDPAREEQNLDGLRAIRPAGVLLAPLGRSSDRAVVEAFCADVPTVLFDSDLEGLGHGFIGSDNTQSIGAIVTHLCATGAPPCFLEMRTPPNPNALKRQKAFVLAMATNGHEPHILKAEGTGWDFEAIGYEAGLKLLSAGKLPSDTVLCSNDRLAIGFLAAAYEKGLRVGSGRGCALRVAGHDDHPFARFTCPGLTTVAQNYTAIARRSLETLLGVIDTDETAAHRTTTLFDGALIIRDSA
jgi:DNA-binding LacI/PurR family transcriptional regulator